MDERAFGGSQPEEYDRRAEELYGHTPPYQQMQAREQGRTAEDRDLLQQRFRQLFAEAGTMKGIDPAAPEARALVQRLQAFITEHMYTCTDEILQGLGQLYVGDPAFTHNIDSWGGDGTAAFVSRAIAAYCRP